MRFGMVAVVSLLVATVPVLTSADESRGGVCDVANFANLYMSHGPLPGWTVSIPEELRQLCQAQPIMEDLFSDTGRTWLAHADELTLRLSKELMDEVLTFATKEQQGKKVDSLMPANVATLSALVHSMEYVLQPMRARVYTHAAASGVSQCSRPVSPHNK